MTDQRPTAQKQVVIWVVSRGEYSDYRVLAAFDSKRRAEEAAAALNGDSEGYGRAEVESLPYFDRAPERIEVHERQENVWDDGTASDLHIRTKVEWEHDMLYPERIAPVLWRWVRAPIHKGLGGRLEVYGTDADRVARVFSDRKAQLLAEDAFRMRREAKG